jgi:hypothetical protein
MLTQNFQNPYSNKPFKILNTDENFLIAINEPKELIAIFEIRKVVVSFQNNFPNIIFKLVIVLKMHLIEILKFNIIFIS